jgi:hypothetical protein
MNRGGQAMLRFLQMPNDGSRLLRQILIVLLISQIFVCFTSPRKLVAKSTAEKYLIFRTKQWTSLFDQTPEILVSKEAGISKKAKFFRIFMTSSICSNAIKKPTIRSLTEDLEKINIATTKFMRNDIELKDWLNAYEDRDMGGLETILTRYNVQILSIPWSIAEYIRRCTLARFLQTGRSELTPFANKASSIEAPLADLIVCLFTNKDVASSPEDRVVAWRVAEDTTGYIPSILSRTKKEELRKIEKHFMIISNQLSRNYNLEDNEEVRFTADGVRIELKKVEQEIARELHEK